MAFDLWVSPEQLSTFTACSSSEARLTGALTADLWTKQIYIQTSKKISVKYWRSILWTHSRIALVKTPSTILQFDKKLLFIWSFLEQQKKSNCAHLSGLLQYYFSSSPRCRTPHMNVWDYSRRSDNRDHSPCSRCQVHSGHSVDQLHSGDSDTDHWCGCSDSRWMMDSWTDCCPAGYKHTLWTVNTLC